MSSRKTRIERYPLTTLHARRLKTGLTIQAFAREMRVAEPFMSFLEIRFSVARADLQQRIADYFKCSIADLFDTDGRAKLEENSTA